MKKSIYLSILLIILYPAIALAQTPTPAPAGGGGAIEGTDDSTLPYNFEPIEYNSSQITPLPSFSPFDNADFVNMMGSVTLTVFTLFDDQQTLATFVVILLAMFMVWRIYKFTTTSVPNQSIPDLSVDGGSAADSEDDVFVSERRYFSNPYKVYRQTFKRKD